ncbi:hypothetical protein QTN47_05630 [Danxiaibacter flavus]|uniref:Outer membrane protein beta-barrel domain-containing protein n=1 Tax=Danxiaibacter flavus TaxID=3049108 RepID=A0ABV3ZAS1_9BACT|nr:hypothetical protein QNM32_05630 [Chitinophagaceae bacterium DXS]
MKRALGFILLLFGCLCVNAQSDTITSPVEKPKPTAPWFVQRFKVAAGGFVPINNTQIEVGSQDGSFGTTIDFENDLGYSKTTGTFLGDLQWRISRRSRLDFAYYHIDRSSSHRLEKNIEFKDKVYPVNATAKSYFNTDIFRLSYGYAFFSRPRFEAGALIGAHIVKAGVGLSASGTSGNIDVSNDFGFTAPLPDVGLWGGYVIAPRWSINGEISYLALKVDNVDGRLINYNIAVMYEVLSHFTLALGYTGLNFRVDVDKDKYKGFFKWGYNGPSLVAAYSFGKKKW